MTRPPKPVAPGARFRRKYARRADCARIRRMSVLKVVIAPDSFKECLPAEDVAQAMARGVRGA